MSALDEHQELIEEIASWDPETYPLAKHARRLLEAMDETGED